MIFFMIGCRTALDFLRAYDTDRFAAAKRGNCTLRLVFKCLQCGIANLRHQVVRTDVSLPHRDLCCRRIRTTLRIEYERAIAKHVHILVSRDAERFIYLNTTAHRFEAGFLQHVVTADTAGPDHGRGLDFFACSENYTLRSTLLDRRSDFEGNAFICKHVHGILNQLRIEARRRRRSRFNVIDLNEGRIHVEFLAQLRDAVSQLADKFNTGEARTANHEGQVIRAVRLALEFGELIFNMLANEANAVNASNIHGIFLQTRDAECFRLAAEADDEIVVRQGPLFENNLFLLRANLNNRRFHEINFKLIDQLQNVHACIFRIIRSGQQAYANES